jgi:hypothetical protein
VTIAGTVAEAQADGLQHPNCRHNLTAFVPGLTVAPGPVKPPTDGNDRRRAQQQADEAKRLARRQAAAMPGAKTRPTPATAPADTPYPGGLTASRADAWMNNRWGTDRKGRRRGIFLTGMSDQVADAMAQTMDTLMRAYPATAEDVRLFGASNAVTQAAQSALPQYRITRIGGRTYADANRLVGWIRFNASRARKPDTLLKSLQNDVRTGFHPPGTDTVAGIVRHEFGHHVMYRAGREAPGGASEVMAGLDKILNDSARTLGQSRADVIASEISRYARKNYDELVAEAFAYVASSTNPSKTASEIVRLVSRYAEGTP